jgi:catechol 2,3-dioxygenase-like lactoylglutathione lyase family enzyme
MSELATRATDHRVKGVNHAAFPTFDPAGTVRFYRDVLGFPVVHAICAKGWGPVDHPDFVHFFFDIGDGDRIAFFYYFGLEPFHDRGQGDAYAHIPHDQPLYFARSRHLAIHVESEADMLEYKRRLDASEWPCEMVVRHETIESIYVHDPNGYFVEVTRPMRPVEHHEVEDANLTIEALLATLATGAPSMEDLWEHKAKLIDGNTAKQGETTLFVLDVPEVESLVELARKDPTMTVKKVGDFYELSKEGPLVIERKATQCRHAVWYSAVAGVRGGKITQYDKDALRVEPV